MTTEITTYSQLNAIVNQQYDAIDGDLQETAASSRLQASLQAEIRSWEGRNPPAGATDEEAAEFYTTKNNALASLREQVADLEASQNPNALLEKLNQHLEVVKAAKASYAAFVGSQANIDPSELSIEQAPLNVGSLDLSGEFNISNLSASDITALITALFRVRAEHSAAQAFSDPSLRNATLQRHFDFESITTDTEAGASITAQLQALEWAPPELLELAEYAASVGINNSDLTDGQGLQDRLSGLNSNQVRGLVASAQASLGVEGVDRFTPADKVAVLQGVVAQNRASTDPNVSTTSDIPLAVQEAVLRDALENAGDVGARILQGLADFQRADPNVTLADRVDFLVEQTVGDSRYGGVRLTALAAAVGAESPAQIAAREPLTDADKHALLLYAADAVPRYGEVAGDSLLQGVPHRQLIELVSEAATRLLGGANPRQGDTPHITALNANLDSARLSRINDILHPDSGPGLARTSTERLSLVLGEEFLSRESGSFGEDRELDFPRLETLYTPPTVADSQLDALLDTELSDGQTIRSILQDGDSAVPYRDSAFWGEVAEELYVSNLTSSLANDTYQTIEINETGETNPEVAQQLLAALANLLAYLDRAAQAQDEKAGELLQLVKTEDGQQRARALILAISRVISSSTEVAETIAGNIGPDEDQQRVAEQVQQQRVAEEAVKARQADAQRNDEIALAAADFVYDPSTVDNSAQAIISGPGAGRDDVITVRLAQALLEANQAFFNGLGEAAQSGSETLAESIRTQADASTARDYTPSYI